MSFVAAFIAAAIGLVLVIAGVRGTQSGIFQAITGQGAGDGGDSGVRQALMTVAGYPGGGSGGPMADLRAGAKLA